MDREECEDGEGGGIPVTPVYEDMHANNDIRGKRKIKPVCDDQSPESNPKSSSVVLCGHQACSFVRTYQREKQKSTMSGCPDDRSEDQWKLTGFLIMRACEA
jgi:hypothetical protein